MDKSRDYWLDKYLSNITSQGGEDGLIEKIFAKIGEGNNWCVEFGAWDGKRYSNTFNLLNNKNWKGILIETNKKKYKELLSNYRNNPNVYSVNKYVSYEGENSLDNILSKYDIPFDFDLLSIDIDGNDYHVWDSLINYQPKLVIIEFNQTIPNDVEFVQKKDFKINHGSSILAMVNLARKKEYELIYSTSTNLFFVKKIFYERLDIKNNEIDFIKPPESTPRLFQLYDGTLVITQGFKLIWSPRIIVNQYEFQVIPKYARGLPDNNKMLFKNIVRNIYLITRIIYQKFKRNY